MESGLPVKVLQNLFYLMIILFLVAGCISPGAWPSPASQTPYEMDARCGMQELNMTFFHNWTIVPITDEDLRPFPEFAKYLQNEDANSPVLVRSFRAIKFFSCNESRAVRFIALSQKFGENHNPHALEYRGHYYHLSCDSYSGTTARPGTRAPELSAAGDSEPVDIMSDSLVNQTSTINGETMPEIQWVNHQIDGSKVNKPLTREEFLSVNREYIDYLEKTVGKESADKFVNDTLSKRLADISNITNDQR